MTIMTKLKSLSNKILTTVLFVGLTFWLSKWGFFRIMSQFAFYDDEGLMIYVIKNYLNGNILYDQLTTLYGPAFFAIYEIIMSTFRLLPTHDHIRLISLTFWIAGSFLLALSVYRLNRKILASSLTYVVTFIVSSVIIREPGHPQALLYALTGFSVLLITFFPNILAIFLLGITCGVCLLIKINVGVFMILAIGWALLNFVNPNRWINILKVFWGICLLALPLFLMAHRISNRLFFYYLVISIVAIINLLLVRPKKPKYHFHYSVLLLFCGGLTITCLAIFVFILHKGTSLQGLYDGLIGHHFSFAGTFWVAPYFFSKKLAYSAILSLIACVFFTKIYSSLRNLSFSGTFRITSLFSKKLVYSAILSLIACAFFGMLFACRTSILSLMAIVSSTSFKVSLLIILHSWSWVFFLTPAIWSIRSYGYLSIKYSLLSLATLFLLIAFPATGSEVAWAFILLIPILFLLLTDNIQWITSKVQGAALYKAFAKIISFTVLVLMFLYLNKEIQKSSDLYYKQESSKILKGSSLLRLPDSQRVVYEQLVLYIRQNAKYLLTVPGMYSFSLWSEVEPPTLMNQIDRPLWFDAIKEQELLNKISSLDGVVVLYNKDTMEMWEFWCNKKTTELGPVMAYIKDQFVVIKEIGGYEILVNKSEEKSESLDKLPRFSYNDVQ